MSKFMKKIRGGNGFTLVEMLIVVAIIAILIAISIPLVNNALDKARHATDAANERAAKAEILIQYLADGGTAITKDTWYAYHADTGKVDKDNAPSAMYGKHKDHTAKFVAVQVGADDVVSIKWTNALTGTPTDSSDGLCSTNSH